MIFKISKNSHYSNFKFPKLTFNKKLVAKINLISGFVYKCDINENQKDTNKIIGLSDDYFHQINSIRIGFRYFNGVIELMVYYYNNSKHNSIKIGEVLENNPFKIEIEITNDLYIIKFNKNYQFIKRTSKWKFIRYVLFPYFGGQEKSKSDIKFDINYKII